MHHSSLADTLNYNLYTNSGMTLVWGDGTHSTVTANLKEVTNNITINFYGRIFPEQNVSPGSYNEQLVVMILY
jgi:spore coat protein U-like protein